MEGGITTSQQDFLEFEGMSQRDASQLPPLVLAYVGDAVYELVVRTYLVRKGASNVNKLHRESIQFVSARAQAELLRSFCEILTEEETQIFKRGRNARTGTIPKNASVTDYHYATGFEALIGFLYLTKNFERLNFVMNNVLHFREEK